MPDEVNENAGSQVEAALDSIDVISTNSAKDGDGSVHFGCSSLYHIVKLMFRREVGNVSEGAGKAFVAQLHY